jgi:SPASM domain peptide maturase of grasp-with-spasm system
MNNYLNVFANCFLTKGANRSTIFDYQREDLFFIENVHYDFLMQCKIKSFDEVSTEFSERLKPNELEEFIAFCEENELVFWTGTPHYFPEVDVRFEHPSLITNAIIDINKSSNHDFKHIFSELQKVGCKDIQLRFYDAIPMEQLEEIIQTSRLNQHGQSLELFIKATEELTEEKLVKLTHDYIFIKSIVIHTSEKNELFKVHSHALRAGMGNIIFTMQEINSSAHCGNIHSAAFNYNNIAAFMEAKLFNSCLNRKVGIDVDGAIKNCPTQVKSFGNIQSDDLLNICLDKDFQELWNINKDQIDVCKECEFRYICTDCRMFLDDDESVLSKPKKCNYNPYTNVWEN